MEGTATEEGTGAPLEATIEFLGTPEAAQSDPATGYYSAQVCAGTYTMRVSVPSHRTEERKVTIDGDQTQDLVLLELDLDLALAVDDASREGLPGQTVTYTLVVSNAGGYTVTYSLSLDGNAWPAQVAPTRTQLLPSGEATEALVRAEIPAEPGAPTDAVTVRPTSGWDPTVYEELDLVTGRFWSEYLPLIRK